jgi:hypothetical protein
MRERCDLIFMAAINQVDVQQDQMDIIQPSLTSHPRYTRSFCPCPLG